MQRGESPVAEVANTIGNPNLSAPKQNPLGTQSDPLTRARSPTHERGNTKNAKPAPAPTPSRGAHEGEPKKTRKFTPQKGLRPLWIPPPTGLLAPLDSLGKNVSFCTSRDASLGYAKQRSQRLVFCVEGAPHARLPPIPRR